MLNFDRSVVKMWYSQITIIKIISTSGFLTALECTKFFGRGSVRIPPGSLQRSPDPLAGLMGPNSKGEGGRGEIERRRERETVLDTPL